MAYGLSRNGSDWAEVKIKDTETMEDLEDVVSWYKFTRISWTHDNQGFFYTKFPEPATIASTDPTTTPEPMPKARRRTRTRTRRSNPLHMLSSSVTDCGAFIIVYESSPKKRSNLVKVTRLGPSTLADPASITRIDVVTTYDSMYRYVTNEGSKFYFHVSHPEKSPRGKIVVVDVENLGPGFVDVVPETEDILSKFLAVDGDKLVLVYLRDLRHLMYVHELRTGKRIGEVEVPLGTIGSLKGDKKESELFFSYDLPLRLRYFQPNPHPTIFRGASLPDGFDPTIFTTKQVRYSTKDGTEIPMFLLHRTGLTLDSSNPTPTAVSASRCYRSSAHAGSSGCATSRMASWLWPTSVAAVSSARSGMKPEFRRGSRTCLTISSMRLSGCTRKGTHSRIEPPLWGEVMGVCLSRRA
ncbi:prolyl oligopeptidase [Jimgerdemannia flammicorona]|uniref:Prolyl oligopeptidase n=1 Tax=Jimgerdemannia flammicorona TaxID=994334 RepID=A0A433PIU0_9FUNG|nr:prolyl oligopeptidase [Jimgerdemannia flammicorona]